MFEVTVGISNTSIAETVEEVRDKIFAVTDNRLLTQRIVEICRLMRKGDVFSKEDIIIKRLNKDNVFKIIIKNWRK